MIRKTAAKIGRSISDALFPLTCAACGRLIQTAGPRVKTDIADLPRISPESAFREVMNKCLCPSCLTDFAPIGTPYCTRCGEPFKSAADTDHLCSRCITRKRHFTRARSCAVYDGSVLKVIHAYKYRGRTRLAKPLGILLYLSYIRHFGTENIDTALPVPLHEKRLKSRGFNQALLMIRCWPEIEKNTGRPSGTEIKIETGAIVRSRNTATQTGLERSQRVKNIKNAFAVKSPERIKGKNVLLVDDVYTTGSTVGECGRMLADAGAAGVYVLTLARTV